VLLVLCCWYCVVGTVLLVLCCWYCIAGTVLLVLCCWFCVVGTVLLVLYCWYCVAGSVLLVLCCWYCVACSVLLVLTRNVKLTTVNRSACVPECSDLSIKPEFPESCLSDAVFLYFRAAFCEIRCRKLSYSFVEHLCVSRKLARLYFFFAGVNEILCGRVT